MNAAPKVLFVVGAGCIAGWFLIPRDDAAVLQTRDAQQERGQAQVATATDATKPATAPEREAAPTAATAEGWLDHPYTMTLAVRVVDPLGLPVEGHRLQLAPFGCPMNDAEHKTDADGRVELSWSARTTAMEIDVAEPLGGIRRRVTVQHGTPAKLVLLGEASGGGTVLRFFASTGNSIRLSGQPTLERVFSGQSVSFSLGSGAGGDMTAGLHPFARFTENVLRPMAKPEPATEASAESVITLDGMSLGNLTFAVADSSEGKLVMGDASAPPKITGTVFGEDGKALAKQPVALLGSGPQPLQRTETDEHGAFTFENVQAGTFTVRAGGDRAGLGTAPAPVTTGATPVAVHLRTGSCVRGRALDAAGQPLANARIEWRAADGSWCDMTKAGDDGAFVFANLPGGPGSVLLFPADGRRLPLAILPAVLPDAGEAVLQPKDAKGSVTVQPIPVPDHEAPSVRCWQLDTGMAMRLREPQGENEDTWTIDQLSAGFYEFEAHTPGIGRRSLGKHWVDGKSPLDLGRVELPRDGEIVFELPAELLPIAEDERAWELCMLRKDADVRALESPPPLDRPIRLPIGDWVFAYKHRSGAVRFHRFTVKAGERTVVAPKP